MARCSQFALTDEHFQLKDLIEKREAELKDLLQQQEEYVRSCQKAWAPRHPTCDSHDESEGEKPDLIKKLVKIGSTEELQLDLSFVRA